MSSDSEISYGDIRLSVLGFQDDALRVVSSVEAAQKGNIFLESVMKRKQLHLSIPKCSTLIFEKKNRIGFMRAKINKEKSLKIFDQQIEVKEHDQYLGDTLHEGGLTKSVKATIDRRYGRIFAAVIEVASILEDFRIDTIGGIRVGLDIFELSVVPSLLNNAETWVGMNTDTEDRLDNLQNCMFRTIFAVPKSTPKPILRWDLGHLSMKEKIHAKKLNFLLHLKNLPNNSLAAEFYDIQVKLNFPGLVEECRNLLQNYNLPN